MKIGKLENVLLPAPDAALDLKTPTIWDMSVKMKRIAVLIFVILFRHHETEDRQISRSYFSKHNLDILLLIASSINIVSDYLK